jgi:outer membrane lipoprotein-sorting protein
MSALGDLLESLHEASRRFDRARIAWRTWHHDERALAIRVAAVREGRLLVGAGGVDPDAKPLPPERTGLVRVWFERPDRWREVREGDEWGPTLTVRDGGRLWTYDDTLGALSDDVEGNPAAGLGEDLALHLDPAPLIGQLTFEPGGLAKRAGRPVVRARATPRLPDAQPQLGSLLGALGADELLLEMDLERGVLLRTEVRRAGEAFRVYEAEDVEFDATHPPQTFSFEPPRGEEIRPPEGRTRIDELPLYEAARRAPFAVFVPTDLPDDWGLAVTYISPHQRPPAGAQVHLWYRAGGGVAAVNVIEQAEAQAPAPRAAPGIPDWREQQLGDGTRVQVRDRTEDVPQAQLTTTLEGTTISIDSTQLDARALTDLAASLRPAPTEAPKLGRSDS